eukprot:11194510-Lingulodinium_polyedra.AAC.1
MKDFARKRRSEVWFGKHFDRRNVIRTEDLLCMQPCSENLRAPSLFSTWPLPLSTLLLGEADGQE